MNEKLKGKRAVITGSGAGIGKAIAKKFASLGIDVALVARSEDKLQETAKECEALGVKAYVILTDLLDEQAIINAVETAAKQMGGIDILVNNAGIVQAGPMVDVDAEEFDRVFATNVRAPFLMCKYAMPYLKASDYAEIINIASVVAHKGYPWQSIYAASKHAVLGLSKSLANEVYKDDVRVHVIAPGGVYTEMVAKVRPDLDPSICMLPEDIAEAAAFFVEHRTNAIVDEIRLHRANAEPFA
ncbi:MAG: SDR family oxidoreductase [Clostridia bacterium]|nr:SDR family oxidoreductase [Clostridia bacterium]